MRTRFTGIWTNKRSKLSRHGTLPVQPIQHGIPRGFEHECKASGSSIAIHEGVIEGNLMVDEYRTDQARKPLVLPCEQAQALHAFRELFSRRRLVNNIATFPIDYGYIIDCAKRSDQSPVYNTSLKALKYHGVLGSFPRL